MFEKILVPLDGSDLAEGMLPYVSQLARGLNAKVTLLSVVEPDAIQATGRAFGQPGAVGRRASEEAARYGAGGAHPTELPSTPPAREQRTPYASEVFERVERAVKEYQQSIIERLGGELDTDSKIVVGSPAEEIVSVAEEEGCDLIAMSTHARGALGRGILGSVTDKVIHSSPVPVLTIQPEEAQQHWQEGETMGTVIVPLDGSHLAQRALPYAEELAKKLSLKTILVHAVRFGQPPVPSQFYEHSDASAEEEHETEATGYLADTAKSLSDGGLDVTWRVHKGGAAGFIIDLARDTPRSIVALTTRGNSGLTRWVIGSVAEKVVRSSGAPVLIVPGEAVLVADS